MSFLSYLKIPGTSTATRTSAPPPIAGVSSLGAVARLLLLADPPNVRGVPGAVAASRPSGYRTPCPGTGAVAPFRRVGAV